MTPNGHTSKSGKWGISGLLLLAALVAGLAPTSAYAAGYQMPITFSGYTKPETLTNFPVLVVFSNGVGGSFFNFATFPFATTNGYDLRFYTNATDTGSGLNYEIDSWNTNSACYVWVQVPLISSDGTTAITARWGDTNVTSQLPCTTNGATWTNGFLAVWHLPNGTQLSGTDSSTNANNATAYGGASAVAGKVDGGVNLVASSSQYILGSKAPGMSGNFTATIEQWFYLADTNDYYAGAHLGTEAGLGAFTLFSYPGGSVSAEFGAGNGAVSAGPACSAGTWYHVAAIKTPGTINTTTKVLINGVDYGLAAGASVNTPNLVNGKVEAGRFSVATPYYYFNGRLDEIRFASVARSTNWVWAEYQTMASNTTFGVYGMASGTNLCIQNSPAPSGANLGATQATVNVVVATNGGTDATGYLFYDTVDRGTNLTWAFTNGPIALPSSGGVINTLSNLYANTPYYFMYYATNTGGQTCWGGASGVPFTTATSRTSPLRGGDTTNYSGPYAIYTFTDTATKSFTNTSASAVSVELLVVGGGGGGGGDLGGGGGGGAVVYIPSATLPAGSTWWVKVGGGGTGAYYNAVGGTGTNSIFSNATTVVTAAGGGGGGCFQNDGTATGANGGSGGGAGASQTTATSGGLASAALSSLGGFAGTIYGNNGGSVTNARGAATPTSARGGGGAGAAATNGSFSDSPAGPGGDGIAISMGLYPNKYWGGGGGGGAYNNVAINGGAGGKGGGGGGATYTAGAGGKGDANGLNVATDGGAGANTSGGAGGVNTGGGGGGGTYQTGKGGAGGSGIAIVRYFSPDLFIQNGPAPTGGALWTTQAVATATVWTNGGSDATGYLFWDTTDQGHALRWANSSGPIALPSSGVVTNTMTNLAPNTTYYCTWFATNTAGQTCWGGTTSLVFTTLSGAPAVTNTGASAVWYNTATLNGTLTTGTMAWCAFYWWANSTPATTNVVSMGWLNQGASFASAIGGLTFSTAYSYQCIVSNNAGIALSDVATFTTTADSDAIWANTNGGSFATAANWDIGVPPPGRKATFLSNATYRVDFPGTFTNKAADFEAAGGKVTLNIGAGNLWALTNSFSLGTNAGAFATVAVTSGALRATAGTMYLGNGVLTNSGSGVVEVGTPGVTANAALYAAANTTCTVNQVTFRGVSSGLQWTIGGAGTLVVNNGFLAPEFPTGGNGVNNTLLITNGTVRAGGVNAISTPGAGYGGWTALTVNNAVVDMNGYNQPLVYAQTITLGANATLKNSGANATWQEGATYGSLFNVYGTVADGTPGDGATSGVISFRTWYWVTFYRGGQTLNSLLDRSGNGGGLYTLYSTNSTDHNTIYGIVNGGAAGNPGFVTAYMCADTAGHISRTLGGKESDGTTDRFVTLGKDYFTVNLYIQGDGGANLSNGSYTNNNDVAAGATIVLARNDSVSTNVTYTMRNLANGVTANTGTNGFRLKFWGTNTLTASSTHTVTGTLLINQIAESGGPRSLTKAGTGTLEIYGSGLFSTNLLTAGTNIVSGSVTNRYLAISSGAALSMASTGYLKVTNNLVNTNGASTVMFTASPTALGRIDVTGIWSNSATAKLSVDLTGYTWPSGPRAVLATFQSMPTLFAAGNTTIAGAKAVSVYYTPTTLELRKMVGTAVFFW